MSGREVSISFVVVVWNSLKFFFLRTYFIMKFFLICQMQFYQTVTITKQAYSKFRKNYQSQVCKVGKQKLKFRGMPKNSGSSSYDLLEQMKFYGQSSSALLLFICRFYGTLIAPQTSHRTGSTNIGRRCYIFKALWCTVFKRTNWAYI